MKKWIVRTGLALWLMCSIITLLHVHHEPSLPRLYKQVSPAVVWIGAERGEGDYDYWHYDSDIVDSEIKWQGSAFLISDDGLIMTAGHIVENTKTFEIKFQDGTTAKADYVYSEDLGTCDVGFVRLRPGDLHKKQPYFRIDTKIKVGESVVILGHPFGLNKGIAITQGIISLFNRKELFFGTKLLLHTDVASYPGNSGSPIINMDGEVVGMLIGGRYGNDNFSICTTGKILALSLKKCIAFEALERAE